MINSIVSRFDPEIKHDQRIFKCVREGEVNPKEVREQVEMMDEKMEMYFNSSSEQYDLATVIGNVSRGDYWLKNTSKHDHATIYPEGMVVNPLAGGKIEMMICQGPGYWTRNSSGVIDLIDGKYTSDASIIVNECKP